MGLKSGNKKTLVRGLYAIVDSTYIDTALMGETARKMAEGGARVIQLRAKGLGAGETLTAARSIRAVTEKAGALFIVNDRVDVALLAGADGVHLGQEDLPINEARALMGAAAVIGISTHNVKEAAEAFGKGADYVSFGPVFPTRTKGDADSPKGIGELKRFKKKISGTVVAIGGITEENCGEVAASGADSVAIISDILRSGDIRAKVSSIIEKIEGISRKDTLQ